MRLQGHTVDRLREWSYAHPKAKMLLREGWGVSREVARFAHLPAPFEPVELKDLRRLRDTPAPAADGATGRLLILSTRGWSTHIVTETTIAHAARRRGWSVSLATCGGRLPVCDVAPVHTAPPMPCHSCAGYAVDAIEAAGFHPIMVRSLVDIRASSARARRHIEDLRSVAACEAHTVEGFAVGRFVKTSVAWFLSRGTLLDDAETVATYRKFLVSGMVLREAFLRLLDEVAPDRILVLNGAFFPERILSELATQRAIPVTRYEKGFLTNTVLAGRWRPGADDLDPGEDAWREAATTPLRPDEASAVDAYLDERMRGGRTLDNFWLNSIADRRGIRQQLGLREGRPTVAAFLNILWDSAIQDKDTAFASMGDWLVEVIQWAQTHPAVDVVVRLHPAEVKLANHLSREPMADHIAARFAQLPDNVHVVGAQSSISSYPLMEMAAVGLVYTSTVGLEMAARGIPVVCAAATHYGRRGFTVDPPTTAEYWAEVERLVDRPPAAAERERMQGLARRYAHLFFFRYHQFLDVVDEEGRSRPRVTVASAEDLAPGRHPALDRLMEGILDGDGPVITPAAHS
ncbi:MAG TPA: hypothetical protein VIG86_02850 [Candidatus Dormibacteraeota bacterium]|jgi:hypothetical protein